MVISGNKIGAKECFVLWDPACKGQEWTQGMPAARAGCHGDCAFLKNAGKLLVGKTCVDDQRDTLNELRWAFSQAAIIFIESLLVHTFATS